MKLFNFFVFNHKENILEKGAGASGKVTLPKFTVEVSPNAFRSSKIAEAKFSPELKKVGDSAFRDCQMLKCVKVNEGLKEIGDRAFYCCVRLNEINLSPSIEKIGKQAFYNCGIPSVNLTGKLKDVEDGVFSYCTNLKSVVLGDNIENIGCGSFIGCTNLSDLQFSGDIKEIKDGAFCNTGLKEVTLPNISSMGERVFAGCSSLHSAILPSNMEVLPAKTFKNCDHLKNVKLSDNLQSIKDFAFNGCERLTKIDFPKSLRKIGDSAFSGCGLRSVILPDNVTDLDTKAFSGCKNLSEVKLSSSLKNIGEFAFLDCKHLTSIELPESIENLSRGIFSNCKELREVVFPKNFNLEELPENIFNSCSSLGNIDLPKNLIKINEGAFFMCENLYDIDFPQNLKYIGDSAFSFTPIQSVIIPESVTYLGPYAFSECKYLSEILLPSNLSTISEGLFRGCTNLSNIDLPQNINIINDYAFSESGIDSIEIPESVNVIEFGAFLSCKNLRSIKLSDSMQYIADCTFSECSYLTNVEMPKNLKYICKNSFNGCKRLERLNLGNNVLFIGEAAFKDCENLRNLVFPEGLEIIQKLAFENCQSLTNIVLPKSLKTLEADAFKNCLSLEKLQIKNGYIGDCFYSIGGSIQEIRLNRDCKVVAKWSGELNYITKCGDEFVLTAKPLSKDSFKLKPDFDGELSIGVVMSLWDKREEVRKEINGQNKNNIIDLFNVLYSELSQEDFVKFFNERDMKFFNLLSKNRVFTPDMFKLYYNLGGFERPVTEVHTSKSGNQVTKVVDYSQRVSEFFKEEVFKNKRLINKMPSFTFEMKAGGFNKDFAKFLLNKDNFNKVIAQCEVDENFLSKCYNCFEEVQKTNTSNKGHNHQLQATVEKFIDYFNDNKFQGVTEDKKHIADRIGRYFSSQETFEKAIQIDDERIEKGVPNNILGFHLKEDDVFANIDKYSDKIKKMLADSLSNMTEIANKNFTFDWLEKNDPYNFVLGKLTRSCAHLEGVGFGIMHASIVHPDIQNLVIRDKENNIVAKATLYVNRKEGYGLINTIEADTDDINERNFIFSKIKMAVTLFAEEYNKRNAKPLKIINVGMKSNLLESQVRASEKESVVLLPSIPFQDYGYRDNNYNGDTANSQYILWESENENNDKNL